MEYCLNREIHEQPQITQLVPVRSAGCLRHENMPFCTTKQAFWIRNKYDS